MDEHTNNWNDETANWGTGPRYCTRCGERGLVTDGDGVQTDCPQCGATLEDRCFSKCPPDCPF